jgi:hypothetical protein
MNRIVITTVLGVVAGLICALGGMSLGVTMTPISFAWVLLNRTVLGFVIGISGLRLHWAWHGIILGLIVGSLFSFGGYLMGSKPLVVVATIVASVIFGFAIDGLTTVVFKRPQPLVTAGPTAKARTAAA